MNSSILIQDLSFHYDQSPVLEGVSLSIERGKFIGIIGPNGGGKTTLLKLLMGLLKPSKGMISLFGKAPKHLRPHIGYVPQMNHIDKSFPITVYELVLLGALSFVSWKGTYPQEIKNRALFLLEELGLSSCRHHSFGTLSGGQAQKALIAKALLCDPEVLFLDEPTSHVDPLSQEHILNLLCSLRKQKTILMVSHNLKAMERGIDEILAVQKQVTKLRPEEICTHLTLGLYPSGTSP